ncbi:transporter substrate-binding domain-containing protein [Mobilicoccus caccae]|uniref:transporter substrate-binding domain-containing protein n=1 Tax=Mobilicoccus caccae TaxID=1859295 RepID=UPI0024E10321|nr:transporter substrate-binding domain-containing protein [Mobilicoccus caccae]
MPAHCAGPVPARRPSLILRCIAGAAVLGVLALTGCGVIPADPDHTLDRVRATKVLRLGASDNPPLVVVEDTADAPTGSEPDLARGFAERLGVEVEWVVGGESELVGKLEDGEVDMIVGGLLKSSPWEKRASLTRPYATTDGPDGIERKHVMAVPLGENAMLSELERYLDEVAP